jgi:uncharacterized delta-60 repeat protein
MQHKKRALGFLLLVVSHSYTSVYKNAKDYNGNIIAPPGKIILSNTPNLARYIALNSAPAIGGVVNHRFGTNGYQTISFGTGTDIGTSMVLQPDEKIIVAGYASINGINTFAITRLNINGSLDSSFNNTGTKTINFQGINDQAYAVAVQPNGAIVVFGISSNGAGNYSFAVTRLQTNGSLDTSFNTTGTLLIPPATYNGANTCTTCITQQLDFPAVTVANSNAITIQPDGTILLLGTVRYAVTDGHSFAITKLTSTGQLDTTFNGTGFVTTGFAVAGSPSPVKGQCAGYALALQSNNSIVFAGGTESASNRYLGTIMRLSSTGTLDATFNGTGFYQFSTGTGAYGNDSYVTGLAIQPSDQKIIGVGWGASGSTGHGTPVTIGVVVVRLNTDGTLDNTFGKKTFNFGGVTDKAFAVALQPDGKILVVGSTTDGGGISSLALARLNTDGSFDTSFNGTGQQVVNVGGNNSANAVALEASTNILIAGTTTIPANDFLVAEFVNNITP